MHNGANGSNVGRVYMYELDGNSWIQLGQVLEGTTEAQELGRGIAMNETGDFIVAGSPFYTQTLRKVQVYKIINDTWTAYGQELSGEVEGDNFGRTLDFNGQGDILAVSVPFNSTTGFIRGAVKVYQDQNQSWIQIGDDIYGEADEDRAGISISLSESGEKIAIGSLYHDGPGGLDSGHVRVFSGMLLSNEEFNSNRSFQLFPNPTSSDSTIKFGKIYGNIDLKIYDVIGNIVLTKQFYNSNNFSFSVDNLNSGIYIISISTEESYYTSKLIKK